MSGNKLIKALKKKSNMYSDSVKQWNVVVGCYYDCVYCEKSFKAQMKRQMPQLNEKGEITRGCWDCYNYVPHFHEKRLNDSLRLTKGDEFIWCCSSGDIAFAKLEWIEDILSVIRIKPDITFFFQSKDPQVFNRYIFPENTMIGTTIETNRHYPNVSKAPAPAIRYSDFRAVNHPRKIVTIEPIMAFDLWTLVKWIKNINPERVYIGYDNHKSGLIEPSLSATRRLIGHLKKFTTVKTKYIPEK